ncbi:unnamed protein product [Phytomonas sp. EM1]|nr:unnamed protein product [Phytomonas sp. EM1]|eukprot:CCW63272.1 unnamed protein product [Phytomonas sp. isolate EM1]
MSILVRLESQLRANIFKCIQPFPCFLVTFRKRKIQKKFHPLLFLFETLKIAYRVITALWSLQKEIMLLLVTNRHDLSPTITSTLFFLLTVL